MKAFKIYDENGYDYIRINKTIAKKLYDHNIKLVIAPCKINPFGIWYNTSALNKDYYKKPFETVCNEIAFYGLIPETGNYLNYYVDEKSLLWYYPEFWETHDLEY